MSNHPTPPAHAYWGPYNNTQQWASHPSSSGSLPSHMPFNQNPSVNPQNYNLESFYANANLPGFGGPGAMGSLRPPPFALPGAFPPPPHFPTVPNVGYPMMPGSLPPAFSHLPPSRPSTTDLVNYAHSNTTDSRPMTTTGSKQDIEREEGELTDFEGPSAAEVQRHSEVRSRHTPGDTINGSQTPNAAHNAREQIQSKATNGFDAKRLHHPAAVNTGSRQSLSSELEEGEASPEPRYSSRDSGSPYNPPLPDHTSSPSVLKSLPEAFNSSGEISADANMPLLISPASKTHHPSSSKSLAQLRVQALGAILSLAPHSIRYNELVGEGINSTVLKQLYEEVGIKVPTAPPAHLDLGAIPDDNVPLTAEGQATQLSSQLNAEPNTTQNPTPFDPNLAPSQPDRTNITKPMERKEVIARMLAAKAAKRSPTSAPPQADTAQTAPTPNPPATAETTIATSIPLQTLASRDKELRVKEKNKAQTELARQRIEQLKKKGFVKPQQKLQPESQLADKGQRDDTQEGLPQAPASLIVQHPLPERPPLPEPASLDRIPGLFMTDQIPESANGVHVDPVESPVVNPAVQPRTTQRKRPRASDFDEPIPVPKRTFVNGTNHAPPERLVIDISDDEFYEDDEDVLELDPSSLSNSHNVSDAESISRTLPTPIDSLPHRPATSQSQGLSTSSTPNGNRNGEQEDLRKKNIQIQAMHRRIAELEQRKKARLASQTQSPRTSDTSPPESAGMPPVRLPLLPSIIDTSLENILAPLDVEDLRSMKSKIVRIQEIEAGLPSLDAEIKRSEAKLADLNQVSVELAKGKEGLRQLLDELNTLRSESNGLSLDQVNMALISLENKPELPVEVVQGMLRRLSIPGLHESNTTTYTSYTIAPRYEKETSDDDSIAPQEISCPNLPVQDTPAESVMPITLEPPPAEPSVDVSNNSGATLSLNRPEKEPSDTSMSDDSSSSMDESEDSSDDDSASVNEEMPEAHDDDRDSFVPVPMDAITPTAPDLPNEMDAEYLKLPDHPTPINPPQTDLMSHDARENLVAVAENEFTPETSDSEAYEPPEPDETASSDGSSYSPAPTPNILTPTAQEDVSEASEDHSQEASEPLTGKAQELELPQPTQYHQIGILDNEPHLEDTQRKFSPYTSPLKSFKAYRYHPNYTDTVSDGYRSLTYSHNIDPMKYLCPFEASGGVCNDRSCEFQHYRDMALSGASTFEQKSAQLPPPGSTTYFPPTPLPIPVSCSNISFHSPGFLFQPLNLFS
ncbi:hypothetical protein BJX99DRAFT_238362 [Aspergillus californicus]